MKSLETAQKLRATVAGLEKTAKPRRSPLLPIAVILLAVGIPLALLVPLKLLPMPAILAGGGCVLLGALLLVLGLLSRSRERRRAEQLAKKRREWQSRMETEEQSVRDLLAAYRMPIRESDLAHALTGLSLLSAQYRAGQQSRRRVASEIAALTERRDVLASTLHRFLRAYITPPTDPDACLSAIHTLRQAIARLSRLEESERQRAEEINGVREKLNRQKQALLPFLHRFDPGQTKRAGVCLDLIGEHRSVYEQLGKRIAEQQQALTAFISEKKLDTLPDSADTAAFDRLSAEDRDLHGRMETLQKQYTVLGSEIDRLAVDADRVPDLEQEQVRMKERISEAKANAATIASTMKLLEESKTALSTRYLDGMQESFRRFFSALTGADAPESLMDTSFEVRLREAGQTRSIESFSRGWRDAVRFCVRLSLTDALFTEGERPFLLLDDPFVNLDDDRLAAARELLERLAEEYQILYLVCHSDRI